MMRDHAALSASAALAFSTLECARPPAALSTADLGWHGRKAFAASSGKNVPCGPSTAHLHLGLRVTCSAIRRSSTLGVAAPPLATASGGTNPLGWAKSGRARGRGPPLLSVWSGSNVVCGLGAHDAGWRRPHYGTPLQGGRPERPGLLFLKLRAPRRRRSPRTDPVPSSFVEGLRL